MDTAPENSSQEWTPGEEFTSFSQTVNRLKAEIAKVMVGQEEMIDLMITALFANGHVLVEGVPGVAKTLAAKTLAKCLELQFSRLQFTPDLMPSDVLGTSVFNAKTTDFEFRHGPVFAQVLLVDEINRAPAKTQAAMFEVMEEQQVTVDGTTYSLESPFMVIATQNPIEQEGTYRLPEAQLDRFLFKIEVGYPSLEEELDVLTKQQNRSGYHDLSGLMAVLMSEEIIHYRSLMPKVRIEPAILKYVVEVVQATRSSREIYLGASPRASLSLMSGARVIAAMAGRNFVTPEDIKKLVVPVLGHRVILTPEREMEGATPAEVIRRLVDTVEVPR